MDTILTVGHGTLTEDEFLALLVGAEVTNLVDIRRGATAESVRPDGTGGYPRTAIMCSESLWWRCHRRLVADHLMLIEHLAVEHLFHDNRLVAHVPMAEARIVGRHLEYPASGSAA